MTFDGFTTPTKNYFPMPNDWINVCAEINNLAELKVIQYVLRHTWGYKEYGIKKAITTDEFMHGRKRVDGTRIDKGTGLSNRSVIDGLRTAVEHGYLEYELDDTDKARQVKYYALKMAESDVKKLHSTRCEESSQLREGSSHHAEDTSHRREEPSHRSEKDTLERHLQKNTLEIQESIPEPKKEPVPSVANATPTPLFDTPLVEPDMSGKWDTEKVVQYAEYRNGRRYTAKKMRDIQLEAANSLHTKDTSLTLEQFKSAYDERYDEWWIEHKKVLHVTDMRGKEQSSGVIRLYAMLDRIEARKNSKPTSIKQNGNKATYRPNEPFPEAAQTMYEHSINPSTLEKAKERMRRQIEEHGPTTAADIQKRRLGIA